jgi:cytochrome c oxidase cbb3-type subunit IV
MELSSLIGSISTVVTVVTFGGIVAWACSRRRRAEFAEAANAPFAVEDEIDIARRAGARS